MKTCYFIFFLVLANVNPLFSANLDKSKAEKAEELDRKFKLLADLHNSTTYHTDPEKDKQCKEAILEGLRASFYGPKSSTPTSGSQIQNGVHEEYMHDVDSHNVIIYRSWCHDSNDMQLSKDPMHRDRMEMKTTVPLTILNFNTFTRYRNLRLLDLSHNSIVSVSAPANLPKLTRLCLNNNALTSEGIRPLTRLTQLTVLLLHNNPTLTSCGLLTCLKQLITITINNTGLSEEEVRTIREEIVKRNAEIFGPCILPEAEIRPELEKPKEPAQPKQSLASRIFWGPQKKM